MMACSLAHSLAFLAQLHAAGGGRRADLLLLLGAARYQLGQFRECVAANDQAIMIDPGLAEVGGWGSCLDISGAVFGSMTMLLRGQAGVRVGSLRTGRAPPNTSPSPPLTPIGACQPG